VGYLQSFDIRTPKPKSFWFSIHDSRQNARRVS
jgi:hypothetical protein